MRRLVAGAAVLAVSVIGGPRLDPAEAASVTCTTAGAPFSATSLPSACWRPYADTSPFNRPIPAGARTLPGSAAIVARLAEFGKPQHLEAGSADTADDWGHPTYYSEPTDPVFTLHCTESWGRCAIEGLEVRIPDAARPAAGGDGHLTVVDGVSGWEYDLWGVQAKPSGGGQLDTLWGGRTKIDGDGLGSDATAARFGNLAGVIRGPELAADEIDHALFMVIRCDSGQHVYPASKGGRRCSDIGLPDAAAPPMGARFQLDMSEAEIAALPVPGWRKTIFRAMARYGMYFGDTGSSSWALQFESGSTYTSFGREDAAVTYAKQLGLSPYEGRYVFNVRDGVDWSTRLRVIDPCITRGTCPADAPASPGTSTTGTAGSGSTGSASAATTGAGAATSTTGRPPAGTSASASGTAGTAAPAPGPGYVPAPTTDGPAPAHESSSSRRRPVRLSVRLSAPGGRAVTAHGRVSGSSKGIVRLSAFHRAGRGRFVKVASRAAVVRRGAFTARVGRFRRGSWRVEASLRGTPAAVDAGSARLSDEGETGSGGEGPAPPIADDGRRALEDDSQAGAEEAPPAQEPARSEARFGEVEDPGPLRSGGYLARGSELSSGRLRFLHNRLDAAGTDAVGEAGFGVRTEEAVRRFQRDHDLLVDGVVGRQTAAALKAYR